MLSGDVPRLKAVFERIELTAFPFCHPLPTTPLTFWDKFVKTEVVYEREHVRPPERLHFRGRFVEAATSPLAVGFAGTSSACRDAVYLTEALAQVTVRNKSHQGIVVSGGAVGVDMAAHMGALDEGGMTIAVLANGVLYGLDPLGPKRTFLQNAILRRGALVSEHEDLVDFGEDFQKRLLQRDRIITALSDILFVVEAERHSASVDTAKRAFIQGKEVYAIDWSKISELWAKPKTSGNEELFEAKVSKPFPLERVRGLSGAAEAFAHLLSSRREAA